jgi:hypothetical protein
LSLITTIVPRLAEAVVNIFVIIDNLLIVMYVIIPLIDRASRGGFNGGLFENLVIVIYFLTAAGQRRPLFSPANGQIVLSTRRRKA